MAKIKSLFGAYSDKLQIIIDNSKAKFAPRWYPQYFSFAPAQQSLTFTSAVGRARIEAAASIVNRDSASPLRGRQGIEKYTGDIPAIKEKMKMTEEDYRNFLSMQSLSVDEGTKRQQLLDLLFGDVQKVGDSAHKRLDIMCLEAVSTGKISLDITNNPDGLVLANPPEEPVQTYSWHVTRELLVSSFVDHWGLKGRSIANNPELAAESFGGTPAPFIKLVLNGNRASMYSEFIHA